MKRKPLANQTLIYDKDCPMCCIYTGAFVKAGVLDKNGRLPYSEAKITCEEWDADRARNEIALVNYENGTVTYGIDSMFTVIGHRFTFLKPLFNFKPFHWLMKKLYSFISYNRKVIAPPPKHPAEIACVPEVNLKYRWLYIIFATALSALLCTGALTYIQFGRGLNIFLAIMGVIALRFGIQALTVQLTAGREKIMDYLGNAATANLQLGAAVALMFYTLGFISTADWGTPLYLLITTLLFNYVHYRRNKSLGLAGVLCLTWYIPWLFVLILMLV